MPSQLNPYDPPKSQIDSDPTPSRALFTFVAVVRFLSASMLAYISCICIFQDQLRWFGIGITVSVLVVTCFVTHIIVWRHHRETWGVLIPYALAVILTASGYWLRLLPQVM